MTKPVDPADAAKSMQQSVDTINKLNEQLLDQAKKGGQAYLDAYESALNSLLDFEKKSAGASQLEWVSALASAHAAFIENVSKAFVSAARQTLG